jgi:chaperonin GroES
MIPAPPNYIVKVDSSNTITEGGIIIPDNAQEKKNSGTVFRSPLPVREYKPMVEEGKKIIFSKDTGVDITLDGEDYKIIAERDIYLYEK